MEDIIPNVYKLNNGLIIGHVYTPCKDLFKIELIVRAGSMEEKNDEIGFAHFIEHLMSFFPSDWWPDSIQNQQELTRRGIKMNAWTSESTVGYWMEGLEKHSKLLISLMLRNFTNPEPPDIKIFKQEKNAVVSELYSIINNAWYNLEQMIEYVKYKGTNLAVTVEYEKNNVKDNAKTTNVMSFRDRLYKPELTTILINSNNDNIEDLIKDIIDKHFPECYNMKTPVEPKNYCNFKGNDCIKWKRNYQSFGNILDPITKIFNGFTGTNFPKKSKNEKKPKFYYIHPESETDTVKIEIHFPIPFDCFDDNIYPLFFIETILSNGLGSRLYYSLRTNLGAVYHVFSGSSIDPMDNKLSYFVIETETSKKKSKKVIDYILHELEKLISFNDSNYISDIEWDNYRDIVEMSDSINKCSKNHEKYYKFFRENLIWGKPMYTMEQVIEKRKGIKKETIQQIAKEIFQPEKMQIFYSATEPVLLSKKNKDIHKIIKMKEINRYSNKYTKK